MTTIAVDGLSEEDFRRSIENRLREGKAGAAIERLRRLLAPCCGPGRVLPERFLTVTAADLTLTGWDGLGGAIAAQDRPGHCITALSIAFGWPGDDAPAPDLGRRLRPHIEVSYYTDEAFPFSQSDRDDLLEGYSFYGCTWAADCAATDTALGLGGIDDLNGALAVLEARLLASPEPDPDELRAGSLGACLLSVLLFEAVEAKIARDGLPRPLCVTAGSNGVYPYFDAPVAGIEEDARAAAEAAMQAVEALHAAPAPRYSSLLMTGIPRAAKRAVLVLEETEADTQTRIAKLRGLNHSAGEPAEPLPEPELAEAAVTAALGSPLMTKKSGGNPWDFRDMLSPPAPTDTPTADEPWRDEPDDWDEPLPILPKPSAIEPATRPSEPAAPLAPEPTAQREVWPLPAVEPASQTQPDPLPPTFAEPAPAPGFTLLEADLQERLSALLTAHVPQPAKAPEPVAVEPVAQAELCWPYGPGWIEEEDAGIEPAVAPVETAASPDPGLWARLRAWLGRRR